MDSDIESLPDEENDGRVTPGDSIVPEEGCLRTLGSFLCLRWHNCLQSFSESCCGKIKSIFIFITLPCYTLVCPLLNKRPRRSKISHTGIIYFYILLSCTIVLNLWEQREKAHSELDTQHQISQYFEIICMVVAIMFLVYVNESTRGRVIHGTRERNLILYFRTGLYVFGISSLVYAMLKLVNFSNCRNAQNIMLNAVKSAYITAQILFLNRFYKAKLPNDRCLLQVALAHILGTNLSLWIWTLCKEVYEPSPADKKCTTQPIYLGSTERYFYPLFVEYLLLVASMMYELWANVQVTTDEAHGGDWHSRYYQQLDIAASNQSSNQQLPSSNQPTTEAHRRRNFVPSLAVSLVLGLLFASVFIAFVLASNDSGKTDKSQFHGYLIVNICLYCSQIFACYVILVCRQSQRRNKDRSSVDLDDALLYFGLVGIILWEGFHLYALFFSKKPHNILEFANGVIGILEDIIQTVTLVLARRYYSSNDRNAKTICSCALFLLATNFALWCQNSFYIEQDLENPGEDHALLQEKLKVFAYILNPIIIFFRFHSATCCYHLWSIFDPDD